MLAGGTCYSGERLKGILASKGSSLTHISPFPQGTGPQSPSSPSENPHHPSGKAPSPGSAPPSSSSPPTSCDKDSSSAWGGGLVGHRWQGPKAAPHHPSSPALSSAASRPRLQDRRLDGKCQASPNPRLLHLFHFLGPGNHPVDNFLLLVCQLFLLPLSVGLTTGMDRPARLEPER